MNLKHTIINAHITTTTILFLFGLNTEINDHLEEFQKLYENEDIRVILVEPPIQNVYIFRKMSIGAWYEFKIDNTGFSENKETMEISRIQILDLIKELEIDHSTLILSGFSQGGAMALYISSFIKVISCVVLCTYIPYNLLFSKLKNQNLIFFFNTENDEVFPLDFVTLLIQIFRKLHHRIEHFVSEGTHEINYNILKHLIEISRKEKNIFYENEIHDRIEIY